MKLVAVTADDFGVSAGVNEAVRHAHRDGILTGASLMIAAPAARDAAAQARADGLPVGLHLTLADGVPVLPPDRVSELVDSRGRFRDDVVRQGVRIWASAPARREAAAECDAQVRAFLDTGLALDHLNGHHHIHIHPVVLDIVIALARRYHIPAVRVPIQPGPPPLGHALATAVMVPWAALARRRLRRAGIRTNDVVFGLYETGALTEAAWLALVPRLGARYTEIYCHPTTAVADEPSSPARGGEELTALLSARVRAALHRASVRLVPFSAASRC